MLLIRPIRILCFSQGRNKGERTMSTRQIPLTYERILDLFQKSDQKFDRMVEEFDRQSKETNKKISDLGSRIGDIIQSMVEGNIVEKFQALKYDVTRCSRNVSFKYKKLGISGEVDLFLENGDVAILIEVKTTLETSDVRKHIARMEKYRRYADATSGDKRRFIGAVAGAVVMGEAAEFARENGLYVIVQSGDAVEIVTPPDFRVKEW